MKISPSYIQLLSHFTIQTHDAESAMKAIIASILKVTVCGPTRRTSSKRHSVHQYDQKDTQNVHLKGSEIFRSSPKLLRISPWLFHTVPSLETSCNSKKASNPPKYLFCSHNTVTSKIDPMRVRKIFREKSKVCT